MFLKAIAKIWLEFELIYMHVKHANHTMLLSVLLAFLPHH